MPRHKPDPLEIRFHLLVRADVALTLTNKRYNEVVRQWIDTGKVPDGFKVPPDATEWRNTARKGNAANWRTGNNRDAVDTLLGRLLPVANFKIASRGGGGSRPQPTRKTGT